MARSSICTEPFEHITIKKCETHKINKRKIEVNYNQSFCIFFFLFSVSVFTCGLNYTIDACSKYYCAT